VKILPLILLISVSANSICSQTINYPEVFGEDWKKAVAFENNNRNWMEPILTRNQISYPLAIALIFPELVRYSALSDKMEVTLLKALYINLGEEYANFSIGVFQMKPSFAVIIREKATAVLDRKSGIIFKDSSEFDDIRNFRKSIVTDLEDPKYQLFYLIVFLKICEEKYRTNLKDIVSRVKFLATAYNYGIDKTADQIESMIDKKFFNTRLFKTENYSYADVSLFWYNQYMVAK
jgi:hypothetical protein